MKETVLCGLGILMVVVGMACVTLIEPKKPDERLLAGTNQFILPPRPAAYTSSGELWAISHLAGSEYTLVMDTFYYLPTKDQIPGLFPKAMGKTMRWRWDVWDCDDFAVAAWGYARYQWACNPSHFTGIAVGLIGYETSNGGRHAACVVLTEEGDLIVWDPQLGETVSFPEVIYFIIW